MADWLAHNGLTPALCSSILQLHPDLSAASELKAGTDPTSYTTQEAWELCARAASSRLPELEDAVHRVLNAAQVNFFPDLARYPRAFTLHDNGKGVPYISCPWQGCQNDLLTLAHEFGHALQIVASEERRMPPVLRETCASQSELWFIAELKKSDPTLSEKLARVFESRANYTFTRVEPELRAALTKPDQQYQYQWNYPLAQSLAWQFEQQLENGTMVSVFQNLRSTEELVTALTT
ncbi:hypothetical protein HTT03_03285 [Sulfitobacter sp. S0837]|uniref:hypothetical protein n=1 Tax=Sulfitobacter maritimus TaxID=2741719 RepID=UPI001582DDED|nr:hypothetical protein [Sulfitobacter maritimus]NUH64326.1 hypothetical protein [Sulfitobacter maritimus]